MAATSGKPFRLTTRTTVGALMCAVGVFGVSCQGDNCTTGPGPPPGGEGLSVKLAPKYILSYVQAANTSTGGLPYHYADSAGLRLRVWSDTLVVNADLTYTERGRISQLNPTTQDELVRNYSAPTNTYTLDASGNPSFPKLLAGPGVGLKQAGYAYATLQITIGGNRWQYYPLF
jgi:hypothetical protein